jgi:hypothetical protein
MVSKFLILAAVASIVFYACTETSATAPGPQAAGRPISAKLRATCPDLNAASRKLSDTLGGVKIDIDTPLVVIDSIFDSAGAFKWRVNLALSSSELRGSLHDTAFSLLLAFNGAGVPAGHYFQYWRIIDSARGLIRLDSNCVGLRTKPTP